MAFAKRVVAQALLVVMMAALLHLCHAAVYKVGDSAGWTTLGNIDYQKWAASKKFQVGDIIIFEYHTQFHNVLQVTDRMYEACNVSAPLATYTTGNDSISITAKGHHYFLCGTPGHCQAGQKVDINTLGTSDTTPTPAPSVAVPASSPSSAISFKALNRWSFIKLGLAMAALASRFH
ncbi:hypothetical protein PTKIN_Ptkin10aG0056900 [Pterospermum kingtungense]